jgi:hypothetical protein
VFPDVSKEWSAILFKGKVQELPWTALPLKMTALCSFELPGNTNPATQRNIPEDPDPQHHRSGTLRSHIRRYFSTVITLKVVCYWLSCCFVIQEVPGSNLALETGYLNWGVFVTSLILSDSCCTQTYPYPTISFFTRRSTFRRYTLRTTDRLLRIPSLRTYLSCLVLFLLRQN